jgi:hypothetical protein
VKTANHRLPAIIDVEDQDKGGCACVDAPSSAISMGVMQCRVCMIISASNN